MVHDGDGGDARAGAGAGVVVDDVPMQVAPDGGSEEEQESMQLEVGVQPLGPLPSPEDDTDDAAIGLTAQLRIRRRMW